MTLQFRCFVTGTDTDVGKTLVAAALILKCREQGWRVTGMKPVSAGSSKDENGLLHNPDVSMLTTVSNVVVDPADINPYHFREAIAPHIAASHEGRQIDPARIIGSFKRLKTEADAIVVEGAGGILVPLVDEFDNACLANAMGLPVVLVVGMRLGCLNHALLTQEAIVTRGMRLAGWVANRINPAMNAFDENLGTLKKRIAAPLLGVVPFMQQPTPEEVARHLTLPNIVEFPSGTKSL